MSKHECDKCKNEFWDCKCPVSYETVMKARELVKQGFRQTSRKYRSVARVPAGLTARQAIELASPGSSQHYNEQMSEDSLADQYRRCYAKGEDSLELDFKLFKQFLKECEKAKVR